MRPGPIRPGDGGTRDQRGGRRGGFNEARADSPGRWDNSGHLYVCEERLQ